MSIKPHAHIRYPKELIQQAQAKTKRENKFLYLNNLLLEWITNHILASVWLFDIALVVPLLVIHHTRPRLYQNKSKIISWVLRVAGR